MINKTDWEEESWIESAVWGQQRNWVLGEASSKEVSMRESWPQSEREAPWSKGFYPEHSLLFSQMGPFGLKGVKMLSRTNHSLLPKISFSKFSPIPQGILEVCWDICLHGYKGFEEVPWSPSGRNLFLHDLAPSPAALGNKILYVVTQNAGILLFEIYKVCFLHSVL